jgi:hypothetical protein
MFKLAGRIIDAHDLINSPLDHHKEAMRAIYEKAPDYVKEASMSTRQEMSTLPDACFGLTITEKTASHNYYALPDKAHAWLQAQALDALSDELPEAIKTAAAKSVTLACARYAVDVPEKVASLVNEDASTQVSLDDCQDAGEKVASDDDEPVYGLVVGGKNLYPIHTESLLKTAMSYLENNELSFAPPHRWQFARAIKKQAEALEVETTELVEKCASDDYSEALSHMLDLRRLRATPEQREALDKLASHQNKINASSFADALHAWDQATAISNHMDIPDAYESVFSQREKIAAEDKSHSIARAVALHQQKIASYLGKGVVQELLDAPSEAYDALGEDGQEVLDNIIAGNL